jgi:hypothetical protein
VFTTDYSRVYQRIEEEAVPGLRPEERLSANDLEMVIPVDEIVSANLFSTEIEQEWFEMPSDQPTNTQPAPLGLAHTLLTLLIVWGITRKPKKG